MADPAVELTFAVVFFCRAVHLSSLRDLQGLLGDLGEEHHVVAITELPLLILPLEHNTASYSAGNKHAATTQLPKNDKCIANLFQRQV